MSRRLMISLVVVLILGIVIGIAGLMLMQTLHLFAPSTGAPQLHIHW